MTDTLRGSMRQASAGAAASLPVAAPGEASTEDSHNSRWLLPVAAGQKETPPTSGTLDTSDLSRQALQDLAQQLRDEIHAMKEQLKARRSSAHATACSSQRDDAHR